MTPPCRLSLVFARDAPIAVVLRRGPSSMVEVVKWQTDTDLDHYAPDAGFLDHVANDGAWIGADHRGRRIIVRDGRILVGDPTGGETLLRDFNADTERRVISPQWARNW